MYIVVHGSATVYATQPILRLRSVQRYDRVEHTTGRGAMRAKTQRKGKYTYRRPLTWRNEQALRILRAWLREHGTAPTQQELSKLMGLKDPQGCRQSLWALERAGLIKLHDGRWRGVEITADGWTYECQMTRRGDPTRPENRRDGGVTPTQARQAAKRAALTRRRREAAEG